jgi:cytochrome c-type biogenesis protein CcmH
MIWVVLALITVATLAAVMWPLLRPPAVPYDRASYDLTVFHDQLNEVDRDVARGVLTEAEAGAARLEIQRRILAAGKTQTMAQSADSRALRLGTAVAVTMAVPALAALLYISVGSPTLTAPGMLMAQGAEGEVNDAQIEQLVKQLAEKIAAEPDNAEGLALLGRTYRQLGRFSEAVDTYKKLTQIRPDADAFASLGEVAIAAAQGEVTPEAHDAMIAALNLDRSEPRARFYLGLEQSNNGEAHAAIAIWRDLIATAPRDVSWIGMVRERMAMVAQEAGIPPMAVAPIHPLDLLRANSSAPQAAAPPAAPAPPANPGTAALQGQMSPEQLQMIEGMVSGLAARLESDPSDYKGWMMLGRSYTVLKNTEGAQKAYAKAMELMPGDVEPKLAYLSFLMSTTDPNDALPPTLTNTAADILKIDAAQPDALYVTGLARAKSGDKAGARAMLTQAQSGFPANSPLRADIARRLKELE